MILKKVALVLTLGTGLTSAVTGTQVPDAGKGDTEKRKNFGVSMT